MDPSTTCESSVNSHADWALKLFSKSPLKQKKLQMIERFLGPVEGKTCLDIGSDNGVISYFLRREGGYWYSADLIEETVDSIRQLVGERVDQIDGLETPYGEGFFDVIVIVDFLEHIETDREFLNELYRILKPGGKLILNVPNPKRGMLRRFRYSIGQTDEEHGHVRPGYTLAELEELLGGSFVIQCSASYSRFFSVFIDTLITGALGMLKKKGSQKGTVVTQSDLEKMKKSFRVFSLVYPFVQLFVSLDKLIPWTHGDMLIASCTRQGRPATEAKNCDHGGELNESPLE